jgi:hypothetical protein
MSRCWCGVVLAILVIVFAWVDASWARIVLTILGVLLTIKALVGKCCCAEMMEKCCAESEQSKGEVEQGD